MRVRLKQLLTVGILVCSSLTLATYILLDFLLEDEPLYYKILQRDAIQDKIKSIMQEDKPSVIDPLRDIFLKNDAMLQFYHLPIVSRLSGVQFTEVTSANRDTSYPLAPDFTFHSDYSSHSVTLYEAFQPGCVFRIYLFPVLPREITELHKVRAERLKDTFLSMDIDGEQFKYPLAQLMLGAEYPFLHPLSATHAYPASGLGAYTPFCYQKHLKITYIANTELPRQLLVTTVNCSANDLHCPVHIYSGVSRLSYPITTSVRSFQGIQSAYTEQWKHQSLMQNLANALKSPEHHGPDKQVTCHLQCTTLTPGFKKVIYSHRDSGVISSIKMRVFKTSFGHPRLKEDWTDVLVTARFDQFEDETPQINKVPLGALFGVTGSLNNFSGAALGHKQKSCYYDIDSDIDTDHEFPKTAMTGYFYLPMPYWYSALIQIEGTKDMDDNTLVCYQFDHVPNFYNTTDTGHFHVEKTYYTDKVSGWRNMFSTSNMKGHIVGVFMDVDNLRAVRNVPLNERFAMLQADPVLFVDGRKEASMLGTGLEDYFSYAHGFALAENTTYAFVGNYHAAPRRKEPLTWHAYRLHLLDPIPFHDSVQFIMEGTERHKFHIPMRPVPYFEYRKRLAVESPGLSHMVFYYGQEQKEFVLLDSLYLGNSTSEHNHSFSLEHSSSIGSGVVFRIQNTKFLGQCNTNSTFNRTGKHFLPGDRFSFSLKYKAHYKNLLLRREFHQPVLKWNQRAKLWINEVFFRFWYVGLGTTSTEYTLREDDLLFSSDFNSNRDCDTQKCDEQTQGERLSLEIEPETDWRDVAYHLYGYN